jgi:hypothetical protein
MASSASFLQASLSVSFSVSGSTVATAADAVADAVGSESVETEMFSDVDDSGTGGVGGASSFALLVSFVFTDTKIVAGAVADAAAGALVRFEMFSDDVFLSESSK